MLIPATWTGPAAVPFPPPPLSAACLTVAASVATWMLHLTLEVNEVAVAATTSPMESSATSATGSAKALFLPQLALASVRVVGLATPMAPRLPGVRDVRRMVPDPHVLIALSGPPLLPIWTTSGALRCAPMPPRRSPPLLLLPLPPETEPAEAHRSRDRFHTRRRCWRFQSEPLRCRSSHRHCYP